MKSFVEHTESQFFPVLFSSCSIENGTKSPNAKFDLLGFVVGYWKQILEEEVRECILYEYGRMFILGPSGRKKVVNAASGEGEPSDKVCETVEF